MELARIISNILNEKPEDANRILIVANGESNNKTEKIEKGIKIDNTDEGELKDTKSSGKDSLLTNS